VSRRVLVAVGTAAALAAAAGWLALRAGDDATAASPEAPTATASIERRDLVLREEVDGTLGYADSRPLAASRPGTVTALPAEGSIVARGESLYSVNGRGVRLLYGKTPLWRRLAAGVDDGLDVRQLERNLAALGHDPGGMEVDDHFDADTASAIRAWQDAIGVPETGAVEVGDAVFLPSARRIGAIAIAPGAGLQPGLEVMATMGTAPIVAIDLDARRRALARVGASVRVELPSGRVVQGRIVAVGKVAETATTETGEPGTPTVEVTVALGRNADREGLDGAPVTVSLESDRARNVLAVPVEALLALRGGGYAVELVEDGARRLVAARPGVFADGWVEVRGNGLREGATVVVPA
jgi:peptidoglycan hydrolase-like protein with peptidoglycan-binding domain